jgi:hypothetical protein
MKQEFLYPPVLGKPPGSVKRRPSGEVFAAPA